MELTLYKIDLMNFLFDAKASNCLNFLVLSPISSAGNIIIRQRGTKVHPGENVGIGKDHTLFATSAGVIKFRQKSKGKMFVNVVSETKAAE